MTDIWWGLLVATRWWRKKLRLRVGWETVIIAGLAVMNVLVAVNKGAAIYRWLKIWQWWVMLELVREKKMEVKKMLGKIIPCWVLMEAGLGLAEIIKGGSVNGIMYWLGERRFEFTTVGIAQMSVLGEGIIRAYGTFSHPNSLAGFLLVSLGLWFGNYRKKNKVWWWVVTWSGMAGILLSGSRTVWVVMIILTAMGFGRIFRKRKGVKEWLAFLGIMAGVVMMVIGVAGINYRTVDFVGGWDNDSWGKRMVLNQAALRMWRDNFWLGVGAGNFVPRLPDYLRSGEYFWLQPVHNIFLLTASEIGMLGVIMAIKMMIFDLGITERKRVYGILVMIALTGLTDHYWLTLPQDIWLVAVAIGISLKATPPLNKEEK